MCVCVRVRCHSLHVTDCMSLVCLRLCVCVPLLSVVGVWGGGAGGYCVQLHGARLVATVLSDDGLRGLWEQVCVCVCVE